MTIDDARTHLHALAGRSTDATTRAIHAVLGEMERLQGLTAVNVRVACCSKCGTDKGQLLCKKCG